MKFLCQFIKKSNILKKFTNTVKNFNQKLNIYAYLCLTFFVINLQFNTHFKETTFIVNIKFNSI